MRRPWLGRWIDGLNKPDPGSFGEALEEIIRAERETVNVVPPKLSDADRANIWQRTAEARLAKMNDLRDENTRLRADLALARNLAAGPVDCGHRATLRQYDHDRAVCQREHVDRIARLTAENEALRYGERTPF